MSLVPTDTSLVAGVEIDQEAVLRSLNINIRDPKHQAMLLICKKYDLAPELKHAVIISGNPYITRDGLLHVAHQSGLLNGIVIESQGEDSEEWTAKVTVYVKGQDHGYSYPGRYSKKGQQKQYGPEMAIKCAEVHALRRAFGVTGLPVVEEQWDKADAIATPSRLAPVDAGPPLATPDQVDKIDLLLPVVPDEAMPELRQWKAEAGISMKAGEFTAEMADDVIAKLEELAVTDAEIVTDSAPDPEAPVAPPTVEPDAVVTAGVEVGTAPAGGPSTPGGENVTGGEGGSTSNGDPASASASDSPTPSGDAPTPLKTINKRGYEAINRKCRAIHAEHGDPDKDTAASQWEALAWACSGARTTHLGELTPDEASVFRTRMIDVSEGRAVWVESDDPQWLGWTLDYKAAA